MNSSILEIVKEKAKEAKSVMELAILCKISRPTANKYAKALGIDVRNMGGSGNHTKHGMRLRYKLEDVFQGKHPQFSTNKLRLRMIKEGFLVEICSECGCKNIYNSKPLTLQLDHIDGDSTNHKRENLRLLCPNCHTQTSTFGSRNTRRPLVKLETTPIR